MNERPACESMVPLLLRYADGTLSPGDRTRVEEHAATCTACREAIAEQSAGAALLAELPMPEASPGFAARVRERVAPSDGLLDLLNWRAWTLRLAPVAALLALLAWFPVSTETGGTGATPQASAQIEAWATGGANSTTALLVNEENDATAVLAAVYAGDPQ